MIGDIALVMFAVVSTAGMLTTCVRYSLRIDRKGGGR